MMETLYILRHAKAEKVKGTQADFDRPLRKEGRAAAEKIGLYLKKKKITPSLVLCSPAARARETLSEVEKAASQRFWSEYVPELYMASAGTLEELVAGSDAERLMLVGHNPGLHEYALEVVETGPEKDMAALREKFPAGAFLEIDLIKKALTRFIRPKEL
ncbi:MAG TPA: histidine phosphatase family protein [Sphingomonadales bacterium]|nr:histidine phosphatase family protein [Sphingomonadales bacterium]